MIPLRLSVAVLVFVAASTLSAFALALRAGVLTAGHAQAGILIGMSAALVAAIQVRGEKGPCWRAWDWLAFAAFTLFALRAFCWLLFWDKDLVRVGAPNNLGDICRHLLYARMFADGEPLWPEHPLHAWAMLRYYPGADFFQAIWLSLGIDEMRALAWSGLAGSALAAFTLRRWGGAFALAAFLFAGGLAGFEIFTTGVLKDYQMPLAWKPLPTAIFLTQRGFLFALPAALLLFASWRFRWFPIDVRGEAGRKPPPSAWVLRWLEQGKAERVPLLPDQSAEYLLLPLWVEWLLLLSLAFFQLYAFLFAIGLLTYWSLAYRRSDTLVLLGLTLVPAAPLVALMIDFGGGAFFRWAPGWMGAGGKSYPWFWLLNFGLSLPLAIWLWLHLAQRRVLARHEPEDAAEAFVIPAGIAFLACTLFAFAPWEWDNTKLMLCAYLAAAPYVWRVLIATWPATLRALAGVTLFTSGAVSLAGGLHEGEKGYELAKRSELDFIRVEIQALPRTVRFACAPEYNHPLVLLGRRIAMGYDGHLFGYGLEYKTLRTEVQTLMFGRPGWKRSAGRLGVTHVFWGAREEKRFPKSTKPWEAEGEPVASGEWGQLFQLRY